MERKGLALCMIVKNEEHVIKRCLDQTRPYISEWCIVDTGSTDQTKEIIRNEMKGIPGKMFESEWKDFGTNRTEAFRFCEESTTAKWAIVIDADDILTVKDNTFLNKLKEGNDKEFDEIDGFSVEFKGVSITYKRTQITRVSSKWEYRCPLHEYVICTSPLNKQGQKVGWLDSSFVQMTHRAEGARSKDPNKFIKDASVFESHLKNFDENNGDHLRMLFYLAQSYKDGKNIEKARETYLKRVNIEKGWNQERYVSILNYIILSPHLDLKELMKFGWLSVKVDKSRVEVVYRVLKAHREKDEIKSQELFALGLIAHMNCKEEKGSGHILFKEDEVYSYKFLDELSLVSYYNEYYGFCLEFALKCFKGCPESQRERIGQTIDFAKKKVQSRTALIT